MAVQGGHNEIVKLLLEIKYLNPELDINISESDIQNALMHAYYCDRTETFKILALFQSSNGLLINPDIYPNQAEFIRKEINSYLKFYSDHKVDEKNPVEKLKVIDAFLLGEEKTFLKFCEERAQKQLLSTRPVAEILTVGAARSDLIDCIPVIDLAILVQSYSTEFHELTIDFIFECDQKLKQDKAATKFQALWRGVKVRKDLREASSSSSSSSPLKRKRSQNGQDAREVKQRCKDSDDMDTGM